MITKFDGLYANHVDLDDVGYGGTPMPEAVALEQLERLAKGVMPAFTGRRRSRPPRRGRGLFERVTNRVESGMVIVER